MPLFDIQCAQSAEVVEIHFGGEPETRGAPEYRGFSCEGEASCREAGVNCALYCKEGFKPFAPADAFRHFNS